METNKLILKNMNKLIASSNDSNKVSLTLKGAIALTAVYLFSQSGIDISESDVLILIQAITTITGAIATLYGLARKIWNS